MVLAGLPQEVGLKFHGNSLAWGWVGGQQPASAVGSGQRPLAGAPACCAALLITPPCSALLPALRCRPG